MIRGGLVSISFRSLAVPEIVGMVAQSGLAGIEWGGDVHVPHGNLAAADEAGRRTVDAGLVVAAYGSYYRAGVSEAEGLRFAAVLETARRLGAATVRVWAGNRESGAAEPEWRRGVVDDLARIAALAGEAGVTVAVEFHRNTLTDTNESALRLKNELAGSGVRFYWQYPVHLPDSDVLTGLVSLLPVLGNLHVFQWAMDEGGVLRRRPLAEGAGTWRRLLGRADRAEGDRWALLEFVKDDSPGQFMADAGVLGEWLKELRERSAEQV
jgi:sugar phosphate isomerase/epimerase